MMNRIITILLALVATMTSTAQTVNVRVGSVTYAYSAASVGDMTFRADGTLTIGDKTYSAYEASSVTPDFIDSLYVDDTAVEDNTVSVSYDGSSASVRVAGNLASLLTVTVSGAHVDIEQGDDVAEEITYTLSGTSTDGGFTMDGKLKATIELNGLNLTNPSGPAINIKNGKRINVSVKKDTENTLRDGTGGDWKGCFRCKGHTEFKGKGVLRVYGNTAHAIWSKEYVEVKNCSIYVLKAVGDGINANQYFLQESGTLSISGVGDDGIQVSYETDDDDNIVADDENTGALTISGGTLTVTTTAVGAKGLKSEGSIVFNEDAATASVTVKSSGDVDTSDSSDLSASACVKADKAIVVDAGTLTLTANGQGGRAMVCNGTIDFNGGTVNARAEGSNYGSSGNGGGPGGGGPGGGGPGGGGRPGGGGGGWPGGGGSSSSNSKNAKGIKAKGNLTISGGSITAYSASHEGIESKAAMTISGGTIYSQASDDAINSSGNMTISGGYVYAYSTSNDGLDANGNMYIKGGVAIAFGGSGAETGIDVDESHSLSISGGQLFGIGGRIDSKFGTMSQSYGYTSSTASFNTSYIVLTDSSQNPIFAVKSPKTSYSGICLVSSPSMSKGSTYQLGTATSVSGTEENNFCENPTVTGYSRKTTLTGR